EDVAAEFVGELRPGEIAGAGDRRGTAGEVDPHPRRGEPALQPGREVIHQLGFGPALLTVGDDDARIGAAMPRIDDHGLADEVRPGVEQRARLAQPLGPTSDDFPAEPSKRVERLWAAHAVRAEAHFAL